MTGVDVLKMIVFSFLAAVPLTWLIMRLTNGLKPRPGCPSCQTLVWPWTVTCPNCGQVLLYCEGHPGVEHAPDANFCRECGKHLGDR